MINRVFHLIFIVALLALSSCNRQNYYELLSQRMVERFYLAPEHNDNFGFDVEAFILHEGENDRLLVVPHGTDFTQIVPSYDIEGYALFADGVRQTSGKDVVNFNN